MHPKYTNVITNVHDIALMKLTTRVPDDVPYVEMDMNSLSATYESGHKLWVIGFGKTSFMGDYSNTLKHVQVKFIPNDVCDNMYAKNNEKVVDSMLCADDTDKDACQGDSGGPLYDKDKNILVGVVSWGHGCADSQYPGVYSRISDQWEWIKSTICDNHSNPKPNYCTEPTLNATKSPSDHLHQEEYQDEELESSDR
jgi:secreted trypsin-like serine protease